jgi:hypothetical protein
MSKRFTSDDIWDKRWFRELPAIKKLALKYLFDRCDRAGYWHIDLDRMAFDMGTTKDKLNDDIFVGIKDVEVKDGFAIITDFIPFQYGSLNPKNKAHTGIIALLKKHESKGLPSYYQATTKSLARGLEAPMEEEEEEDKDMDKEKEEEKEEAEGAAVNTADQAHIFRTYCITALGASLKPWFVRDITLPFRQGCPLEEAKRIVDENPGILVGASYDALVSAMMEAAEVAKHGEQKHWSEVIRDDRERRRLNTTGAIF